MNNYDYVIIGSGFGGSVSALRLAEKGYKVLIIEKGRWYKKDEYAKTSWNLKKWLWLPKFGFYGIQNLAILRHVSVINGVGVGGGSLVYANTLPKPAKPFFEHGTWAGLADWQTELEPFYDTAWKMLGAIENPYLGQSDRDFQTLAKNIGKPEAFHPTKVAVYFGEKEKTVADPFFGGKGPERTGCMQCGSCMTGCRFNAKNTLDKNYLHLAQRLGVEIIAENQVFDVIPQGEKGENGYEIHFKHVKGYFGKKQKVSSKAVIFSGGVLGTVPLLLKLKEKSLPNLSPRLGERMLTNNEALIMNVSLDKNRNMSDGIAIGSIIDLDENSHIEPVRYGNGSGFWRLLALPMVSEKVFWKRMLKLMALPFTDPIKWLKVFFVRDFGRQTSVILFMQHLDSTLKLKRGSLFDVRTTMDKGEAPSAFIPEAHEIAKKYNEIIDGKAVVLSLETILGTPSTAHILGGASMGKDIEEGVIDSTNHVFGYENMMICDGSMISANPGVNPSLSITAISERAMSKIPMKE
jgi:cholesterol oxidase